MQSDKDERNEIIGYVILLVCFVAFLILCATKVIPI